MAVKVVGKGKFRFKNKLLSIDSTTIDLCLSIYDWARYTRTKGAVKLHLVLDHDGYLPKLAVITDGKLSDVEIARRLDFAPEPSWSKTVAIPTTRCARAGPTAMGSDHVFPSGRTSYCFCDFRENVV